MGACMTSLNLPYGGREIAELRATGKRPADMVLLSLIGPLRGENNPVVIANPDRSYDWLFLLGLEVLVIADTKTPPGAVRRVLDALKALQMEYLGLWLTDLQDGRHCIVSHVEARPRGLLQHMDSRDRQQFAGLGLDRETEALCA